MGFSTRLETSLRSFDCPRHPPAVTECSSSSTVFEKRLGQATVTLLATPRFAIDERSTWALHGEIYRESISDTGTSGWVICFSSLRCLGFRYLDVVIALVDGSILFRNDRYDGLHWWLRQSVPGSRDFTEVSNVSSLRLL